MTKNHEFCILILPSDRANIHSRWRMPRRLEERMKNQKLTPERFLELSDILLVRGTIRPDRTKRDMHDNQPIITDLIVHAHALDGDGDRTVMQYRSTYFSPSTNYKDAGKVNARMVANWGEPDGDVSRWSENVIACREHALGKIEEVLDWWRDDHPEWLVDKPHAGFLANAYGECRELWEWHWLAPLARLQANIGNMCGTGLQGNYFIDTHVHRLGALIDQMSARLELAVGSMVRTPPGKR